MGIGARLSVLLAILSCPGCFWVTTKHEGDELRAEVQKIRQRLSKQEESLGGKVRRLDESLEEATKLLGRNSADLGTEVEKLSAELAKSTGQVEGFRRDIGAVRIENAQLRSDLEARLAALEARVLMLEKDLRPGTVAPGTGTSTTTGTQPPPAMDKDALFNGAYQKLQAGENEGARREFRLFAQKFPQDDRADNAIFFIGESFAREKSYKKAIIEFQRILDAFPNGDVADDAFFAAGHAAMEMKSCFEAQAYLSELGKRYPTSPLAKTAKQKLDFLRKNAKNKDLCQL
ncbi:MAG: outer membrane protein assembly factor BamD [Deltaproteobacteria bacterium]|nr:outer membrane protein assembly factor BamD [Deltaproteobacteria bacterium]